MAYEERMRRMFMPCRRFGISRNSVVAFVVIFIVSEILVWHGPWHNSDTVLSSSEEKLRRKTLEEDGKKRIEELEESFAKVNQELRKTKLEDVEKLENSVLKITSLEQKIQELNSTKNSEEKIVFGPSAIISGFKGHKLVHLDLKGAPPKLSYLLQVLPLFRSWGATGLLIEYEDTFPYLAELKLLQSHNAYSEQEVKMLLLEAKKNDLIVIPLVQTFGHLEFVLKHPKYSHLRESKSYLSALCPLNPESIKVVKRMIEQIVDMHPDSQWLHVGGDEVWSMKMCNVCLKDKRNHTGLFLAHMMPVLNYVKYKGLTPILWDDMMRNWDVKTLKEIGQVAQPMVWGYVPDVDVYFPEGMWDRYSQAFPKVWAASSFKGADKPYSMYVPVGYHVRNHESWMRVITGLPNSIEVLGVALTGWSRFDHSGTLCELLPAGLPSLALCLGVLNNGILSSEQHEKISKGLGFNKSILLNVHNFNKLPTDQGLFPGRDVYNVVSGVQQVLGRLASADKRIKGWLGPFQIAITKEPNFVHVKVISDALSKAFIQLKRVQELVDRPFLEIYARGVLDEWKHDNIDNTYHIIDALKAELKQKLSSKKKIPVNTVPKVKEVTVQAPSKKEATVQTPSKKEATVLTLSKNEATVQTPSKKEVPSKN